MVEQEWNIGDEFEVISNSSYGYLKKGDRGIYYGKTPLEFSGNITSINFTIKGEKSIYISRIRKINSIKYYELW